MADPVAAPVVQRVPVRNNVTGKTGTIALSEYQQRREEFTPLSPEEHRAAKYAASLVDDPMEKVDAVATSVGASVSGGLTDYWAARNMSPEQFEKYRAVRRSELGQNVETGTDILTAVAGGAGALTKGAVGQAAKAAVKAEVRSAAKAAGKAAVREVAEEGVQAAAGSAVKAAARAETDDALMAIAKEAGNSPLGKSLSRRLVEGAALGPSGLGTRVSTIAGEGVEAALAKAGAPTLGKAAGAGIEGIGEAARQRVSDNLSEASLGGEDITAERLFADVVDDSLLWGGIGAGLGLAGGALGKGRGALDDLMAKRAAKVAELVPEAGTVDDVVRNGEGTADQVAELSSRLSGHNKADIKRVFADKRLQQDFANKRAVREGLTERFRKAWDDAHGLEGAERAMLSGDLKTTNVGKSVRRGQDVLEAARSRMNEATKELLSPSPFLQREAAKAFGRAEYKGLRDLAETAQGRMQKALAKGDEAEAYLALENLKRDLDQKAKTAETALRRGATKTGTQGIEQTRALQTYLEEEAHRVRGFLEDETVWGAAGRNQRLRNEAFVDMLRPAADTRARFTTQLREGAEGSAFDRNTYGSRKIEFADHGKVQNYLDSLSDPGKDVVHQQTMRYFDGREKFLKTALESGEVPTEMVGEFEKALAATQNARAVIREAGERMSGINVLDVMLREEREAAQSQLGNIGSVVAGFATGGVRGGLEEAANVLSGRALARPGSIAARLAVVESMAQRTGRVDQTIRTRVKALAAKAAHGVKRGAEAAGRAGRLGLKAAPASYVSMFGSDPEKRRKAVEKRLDRVLEMHADPVLSMRHGGEITRGMGAVAPAVTAAAVRKHMSALDYVASKAQPAVVLNKSMLQPHLTKRQYSEQQIHDLAKILTVVERPLSLLDDLESGTVSQVQIDAMKAVWPELYADMRLKLLQEIGATKKPLPYSSVVQLSLMLDIPGHPTMDPAFIARQQERYAAEEQQKQQATAAPTPPSSTERMALTEASMNLADRVAGSL